MHKTIPIMSRLQVTTFATLVRAYETEGIRVHSKSDAIWHAVEHIAAMYTRKHGTDAFTDVREAIDYLDSIGLSLGTSTRAISQIRKIEADAAYFAETGDEIGRPTTKKQLLEMSQEELTAVARRIASTINVPKVEIAEPSRTAEEQAQIDADRLQAQREAIKQMMLGGSQSNEDTNTAICDNSASTLIEHAE